jgi:lipopolysaccharide/colanic/teichoic acid biosynthesis glycosyltransferase
VTVIDSYLFECGTAAPADRTTLPVAARAFKRTVDVVGAVLILLVALPFVLVAGLAMRVGSTGPIFFRQQRVGRDGRAFTLYKLRTMFHPNDDSAHRAYVASLVRGHGERHDGLYKLVHDPRITPVGRFLRRFSIDELPQLWNVLRGDMSLIGPRPSTLDEVELFDQRARLRMAVRPGLSGLWQVSGRGELDFDEMIELDLRYWLAWSLRLELAIMLRTPVVVVTARGAA